MRIELTHSELKRLAHHLEVAAARYDEHAASICVGTVIDSFNVQAGDARFLASILRTGTNQEPLKRKTKKPVKAA